MTCWEPMSKKYISYEQSGVNIDAETWDRVCSRESKASFVAARAFFEAKEGGGER